MANEIAANGTEPLIIVGFELGGEAYGIPINCVREIIRKPEITRIPQAQPGVIGIKDLRGTVIPMLDLAFLLGMEPGAEKAGKVVIVEDESMTVGLLVEEVNDVQAVLPDEISRPAVIGVDAGGSAVSGIAKRGDRLLKVLNWHHAVSGRVLEELASVEDIPADPDCCELLPVGCGNEQG